MCWMELMLVVWRGGLTSGLHRGFASGLDEDLDDFLLLGWMEMLHRIQVFLMCGMKILLVGQSRPFF